MFGVILSILLPSFGFATFVDAQGVAYEDSNKETLIIAPSSLVSYTIPSSVKTIIGGNFDNGPFYSCRNNIKSIYFQDGSKLSSLGECCFSFLKLTSINMSMCTELTILPSGTFWECHSLSNIILPKKLVQICSGAIRNTAITSLTIPSTVKTINSYSNKYKGAIIYNSKLETVTWEENSMIYSIGTTSLSSNSITSFHIPKSLTILGTECLTNNKITSITVDDQNSNFKSNGVYITNKNGDKIILYPNFLKGSFTIPDVVTTVGASSFQSSFLSQINLHSKITTIEQLAFAQSKITSMYIPDSVNTLNSRAFWACNLIESIELSNSIKVIGDRLFFQCFALKEVIIPSGVTKIISKAFASCTNIEHIFIPKTVTEFGSSVFAGINKTARIEFEQGSSFIVENFILYSSDYSSLISYMGGTEQMSVSIDWRTRTIKGNAFYGFTINSVTFPSNSTLLVIEESAFGGTPLTSISFPSNVEEIGVKAFSKCSNLKQAILSDSVRYINESAFESSGLEFISIPKQMISIGPKAFMDCKSLGMLSFDSPYSCSIESIGDQCFANTKILSARIPFSCNSLGIKTFEGSLLKSVVFESPLGEPSQMKGVSDKAFIGCESLTEITFGTSISSVGVSSFEGCVSLQSLVLSDRITSIGIMAFKGCYRLETVSIPDKSKLADIGHQSFSGCESLRTFVVGSGTSFQFTAGCLFNREITKIVIYPYGSIQKKFKVPLTVQEISGYSFEGAVSLEEIYLKDCRISRIGFRAFGRCQKLKLVELPSTLSAVDGEAFAECTSLSCGSFQFAEEADIKSQRSMLSKTGLSDYVLHPCATRIFTADENPTAIAVLAFSSAAELTDDAS